MKKKSIKKSKVNEISKINSKQNNDLILFNNLKHINKFLLLNIILTLLGFSFLTYYVFRASENVVSSDYIRLGYYYLHDVHDLKYLFSIESISRIPFTFFARIINVDLFKYNIFFDRILGIFGLSMMNFFILKYLDEFLTKDIIKFVAFVITSFIIFSLNSWEMILNGSGYTHFLAIAFSILAIIYYEKNDKLSIIFLIISTLIFINSRKALLKKTSGKKSFSNKLSNKNISDKKLLDINIKEYKTYIIYIIVAIICFSLYWISNNTGEALPIVGVYDISLIDLLKEDILFPIKFLLASLAGSLVGVETFTYAIAFETITMKMVYLIGVLYLIIIIYGIYIFVNFIINKKFYIVPFMFIVMGIFNYALVFLARYKFKNEMYGMSSRYQLQFMIFLIGLIMYFFKYLEDVSFKNDTSLKNKESKIIKVRNVLKIALVSISLFIITYTHILTNLDEIFKADFRKIIYGNLVNVAKNYEEYSDEDLMNYFEYHRDAEHIKYTLKILKDQHLNVFH